MSTPQAKVRTRKSPAERSREIHEVAATLAREAGLSAVTQRAVAVRAGVASGLVAHYVGSMEDLVAQTFRHLTARELAEVAERVAEANTPAAQLARLIETVLSSDHEDITLVWVDAWSAGRGSVILCAAIDEQMAAWQELITRIVAEGVRVGVFSTEDPEAVGWQILATLDGISAHALTRRTDPAPFATRLAQASEALVGAAPGTVSAHLTASR